MVMSLQAYGICPDCTELHPAGRGCPSCDGDSQAAEYMHTMRVAHVVGAKSDAMPHNRAGKRRVAASGLFAAFGISLLVGSVLIAVLQA